MTWQQWASVLKLSTIWGFHAVREKAVQGLSLLSLEPIDKLILAKKYHVDAWLVPVLQVLARREESLSLDEARRLTKVVGWEFVVHLGRVRETYSTTSGVRHCDLGWNCGYCSTTFTARCYSHSSTFKINPSSTSVVTWPCNSCTTYYCHSHTNYSFSKPAVPSVPARPDYDFTPAIRKEFGLTNS
jgi:hypothetical protein